MICVMISLLTFLRGKLFRKLTRGCLQTEKIFTRREVNVMDVIVEGLMAVMGLAAGLMVVLTTLLYGSTSTGAKRDDSHHDPHTLRLYDERRAA
jgi:hypothetical protein